MNLDLIFPTLFAKTFFILAIQLGISFGIAWLVLLAAHRAYKKGSHFVTSQNNTDGLLNKDGLLDVQLNPSLYLTILYTLIPVYFLNFFILEAHLESSLTTSFIIFSIWSVEVGIMLGLTILAGRDSDGLRALAITALVVALTSVIGVYSGVNFSFLGTGLLLALLWLLILSILSLIFKFSEWAERIIIVAGITIFTLYLIYDFNALLHSRESGENNWSTAMHAALKIFLDVVNLFLQILKAMGHSHH